MQEETSAKSELSQQKCSTNYFCAPTKTASQSWAQFCPSSSITHQHCRWKAAGQWSQHSRSPPSRQLSQVSWLVALPALLVLLSGFLVLFSPSSDLGGASRVWICCRRKAREVQKLISETSARVLHHISRSNHCWAVTVSARTHVHVKGAYGWH